ncbi:hypothetical protein [Kyrpidia sp.]|uniref:hypothetical protein n=1 Tax=Kyrpidia sp. TaxID=2073077 RepID=UPI002582B9A6|nr:hypothetical protein [Kyrpidia sp.]MCL6577287.1 hypothetical protein [Kyrpidia sp.]
MIHPKTIDETTKEEYYDTLYRSSQGWHEAGHGLTPWLEYVLTVILAAYRRFEQRVGAIQERQKRGWKQARIEEVVRRFVADFTISDVEELCPGISRPTIARALNKMSKGGRIRCIKKGRNARWVKNPDVTTEC